MADAPIVRQGRNRLIEAIPERDRRLLLDDAEIVPYGIKQPLFEPDKPIESVYFPTSGVMSLVTQADEVTVEIATIGNEGFVGVPVFLGADSIPALAFGQVAGEAVALRKDPFRVHAAPGRPLHTVLQRYTQVLFDTIAQVVVCNQGHTLEQRFCRWMLMTRDRTGASEFTLTQEFLAQMLAVRRASVSDVASRLQDAGMIRYSRGVMQILDEARMRDRACGCYELMNRQYQRLIGTT